MMNKTNLTTIIGKSIILRPITFDDTDLIVKWRNNPSVVQNFIFREKFTKEMHENWMRTKVDSGYVIQYIVEEKKSGRPIGSVYFRDVNDNYNSAEFGIFIGEEAVAAINLITPAYSLAAFFGYVFSLGESEGKYIRVKDIL